MPVPWPGASPANPRPPDFSKCQHIPDPENQAITLRQLRELRAYCQRLCKTGVLKYGENDFFKRDGKRVKWTQLTQYEICSLILKKIIPPDADKSCSWVELVGGGNAQRCKFFCSHSWGECFRDFMVSIEAHALERGVSSEESYWICVFANNQHRVKLGRTLQDSPFYSALKGAEATLLMLDKTAEALERIWCVFELHETLITLKKKLQIWTPLGRVGSGLVSSGPILQALNRINTSEAKATSPVDQRQILNHIADREQTTGIRVNRDGDSTKELDEDQPHLHRDTYEASMRKEEKAKFDNLDTAVRENVASHLSGDGHGGGRDTSRNKWVNLYAPGGAGTRPSEPRCVIDDGCMRGITLQQLRDFDQRMKLDFSQNPNGLQIPGKDKIVASYDKADIYALDKLYMDIYREGAQCSYVEIVAEKEARPTWHVIYGSQVKFKDLMASLEWHAEARQLPETTAYFIMPFTLDPKSSTRPEETKFTAKKPPDTKKVIENHIIGQVMVLDEKAKVLTRCIPAWEAHMGISKGLTFDLAAASGALATTRPFANRAWEFGDFDSDLAMEALKFDVGATEARPGERGKYLGLIAFGRVVQEEDLPTAAENDTFAQLNARLREKVAGPVLRQAGYTGDIGLVTKVMRACPALMFWDDSLAGTLGEGTVHVAAASGHAEVLELMLDLKAKPDAQDTMGEVPLHYAAFTGKTDIVKLLLARKADPEASSYDAETPLDVARLNPAYFLNIDTTESVKVLSEEVKKNRRARRMLLREAQKVPDDKLKGMLIDMRNGVKADDGCEGSPFWQSSSEWAKSAAFQVKPDTDVASEVAVLKDTLRTDKLELMEAVKRLDSELTRVKQAAAGMVAGPNDKAWIVGARQAFNASGVHHLDKSDMRALLQKVTRLGDEDVDILLEAAAKDMPDLILDGVIDCERFVTWLN